MYVLVSLPPLRAYQQTTMLAPRANASPPPPPSSLPNPSTPHLPSLSCTPTSFALSRSKPARSRIPKSQRSCAFPPSSCIAPVSSRSLASSLSLLTLSLALIAPSLASPLALPSVLAEDAIKAAINDYKKKRLSSGTKKAGHIDVSMSEKTGETTAQAVVN